jgi:hypothetical protein
MLRHPNCDRELGKSKRRIRNRLKEQRRNGQRKKRQEQKELRKNRKYQCKKLISLNLSVKDDKYDTCKTANIKNLGGEILLATCNVINKALPICIC